MKIYLLKKLSIPFFSFAFTISVFAQEKERKKIPFTPYNSITEQIQTLERESNIDEIIRLIDDFHPKDSAYCGLLTSKSFFLIQQKKFDESLEVINQGLDLDCELGARSNLILNKGFLLGEMDRDVEAIELYTEALTKFPKNNKINANLANSYYKQKQLGNSYKHYQKAIQYAPMRGDFHVNFSRIFYDQGETALASMILAMGIFVEPDSDATLRRLGQLEERISVRNPNVYASKKNQFSASQQKFKQLDQIMNNLIVLDKNYKVDHTLSYNYVKQLSAVFSEFPTLKTQEQDFVLQVYYPFYNWLIEEDYFEEFIDVLSVKVADEKVQKYISKKMKDILEFYPQAVEKYIELVQKSNTELVAEDGAVPTFYYENSLISAVTSEKNEKYHGYTTFFNANGIPIAEGLYNEGERVGGWTFYNQYGGITEKAWFDTTTDQRKIEGRWTTGEPNYVYSMQGDKIEGSYKSYLPLGALFEHRSYVNGKEHGMHLSYFKTGEEYLEFEYPFKDDELHGEVKEYFADGSLYASTTYTNGERNGQDVKYYFNGQKSFDASYKDGVPNGTYTSYYLNGQVSEKGLIENDKRIGEWLAYDAEGNITEESTYVNGELDGLYKRFIDGILVEEMTFKKGVLADFNAYHKNGNLITTAKKRKGEVFYQRFLPDGTLTMEGNYDVKGGKTGVWKEYHDNGNLWIVGGYEEGMAQGEYLVYARDGKTLSEIRNYKNNDLHGYYEVFHPNGVIATEGRYIQGEQHGQWKDYYVNGNLQRDQYFHRGKKHATTEQYSPEGKLYAQLKFEEGWMISEVYFRPNGKAFDTIHLTNHTNKTKLIYAPLYPREDGKDAEANYAYGVRNGVYKSYHFNNQLKNESTYLVGDLHGKSKDYFTTGDLSSEKNYVFGALHGRRTNYFTNGNKSTIHHYELGTLHGDYTDFHENGEIDEKGNYKAGQRHGRLELYSLDGSLEMVQLFDNNKLYAYTYLDKMGNEVTPIPIEKNTEVTAYFQNGKMSRTFTVKNGVFEGDYKVFHPDGQLRLKFNYLNGVFHGELEEYYENATLKRKGSIYYGDWHGLTTTYYPNGNKKRERNYNSDKISGATNYYNEDGSLKETRYYFNDEVYEVETY